MEDNKRARPSPQKEQLSDSSILVGELDQDGFAHLLPPSKIIAALADRPNIDRSQHSSESAISTATSEDYDKLAVDPSTVIEGSSGGGLESKPQLPPLHTRPGELQLDGSNERKRPRSLRKTSIPIKLQKTATKGKYMLSVDEPEIREILKQGIERERGEVRRRSTIRDLVFTRQFTTFDRQNPTSAASPFHGFFVLAWLGIAFLIIKLAASNWRACGNIMGENELLTLMFQRDVVSLCVSDCAMMLGTLFGFGLQKLVYSGWLSWDGSAWIIQGVCEPELFPLDSRGQTPSTYDRKRWSCLACTVTALAVRALLWLIYQRLSAHI